METLPVAWLTLNFRKKPGISPLLRAPCDVLRAKLASPPCESEPGAGMVDAGASVSTVSVGVGVGAGAGTLVAAAAASYIPHCRVLAGDAGLKGEWMRPPTCALP